MTMNSYEPKAGCFKSSLRHGTIPVPASIEMFMLYLKQGILLPRDR